MGRWNWGFGPPPLGLHYARHLFRDGHERGLARLRRMQPEAAGRTWDYSQTWKNELDEEDHPTTWIADRAIAWLRRVEGPFFAWVSFPDPHHPFDPPHPWCDRYDPADMRAVLPRPHPEEFERKPAFHRMWTEGFRGTPLEWANPGWALLEERQQLEILAAYYGMVSQLDHNIGRVLAALAAHGRAAEVVDDPVGTIDLVPTVLQACRLPIPAAIEGRPLLDGPREWALTEDDILRGTMAFRTLTTRRYRLTRNEYDPDGGELYDLADDPGELVNRWADPALASTRGDLLATLDRVMRHDLGRELPLVCQAG
jgi:arylsulfatase A-like enzyme